MNTDRRTTAPHPLECCDEARELQQVGDYESARRALSEWWPPGRGRPHTDGLDPLAAAELLLRAGALTGRLASAKQTKGSQARAKELVDESIRLFEQERQALKAAEARAELGWCHWREGDFAGARGLLGQALKAMGDGAGASRPRAVALSYAAIVELDSGHRAKALDLLKESEPLFEACGSDALKGSFYNNLGLVFKELGQETDQNDFFEEALIAHMDASFHFSQAKAARLLAHSDNNLGFVLLHLGNFAEAANHLGRAHEYFVKLGDAGTAAQVKETQARLHLAQGQFVEAERAAAEAVRVLKAGERPAVLAEALTTRGVALARSGRFDESRETLERAAEVAEEAGAQETAGLAALSALEELSGRLDFDEARKLYKRADSLLEKPHHFGTMRRLKEAANKIIAVIPDVGSSELTPAGRMVGSAALEVASLRATARRLSGSRSPMLITGESAGGRGLVALMAHELSGRVGHFFAVNCAAIEDDFDLREFLSREARIAAPGTLFLDEVHELSRNNWGPLLRLINRGVIEHRRGALRCDRIDLWVIAGTSSDLSADASRGFFSPELSERLSFNGPLSAPSAEALAEMNMLAGCISKWEVMRCCPEGRTVPKAAQVLRAPAAEVPGALTRLLVRGSSAAVPSQDEHVAGAAGATATAPTRFQAQAGDGDEWHGTLSKSVRQFKIKWIREKLEEAEGYPTHAAPLLGMHRQTLEDFIKKCPELKPYRTPVIPRGSHRVAPDAHNEEPTDEARSDRKK